MIYCTFLCVLIAPTLNQIHGFFWNFGSNTFFSIIAAVIAYQEMTTAVNFKGIKSQSHQNTGIYQVLYNCFRKWSSLRGILKIISANSPVGLLFKAYFIIFYFKNYFSRFNGKLAILLTAYFCSISRRYEGAIFLWWSIFLFSFIELHPIIMLANRFAF